MLPCGIGKHTLIVPFLYSYASVRLYHFDYSNVLDGGKQLHGRKVHAFRCQLHSRPILYLVISTTNLTIFGVKSSPSVLCSLCRPFSIYISVPPFSLLHIALQIFAGNILHLFSEYW